MAKDIEQEERGRGGGGGLAAPCKDILGNLADNDYNFYNTLSLFCTA